MEKKSHTIFVQEQRKQDADIIALNTSWAEKVCFNALESQGWCSIMRPTLSGNGIIREISSVQDLPSLFVCDLFKNLQFI